MKNIYLLLLIAISYESLGNDAEIKDSGIKLISAGLAISSHLKNDLPDEYTTHTEGGALNLSFKYFSGNIGVGYRYILNSFGFDDDGVGEVAYDIGVTAHMVELIYMHPVAELKLTPYVFVGKGKGSGETETQDGGITTNTSSFDLQADKYGIGLIYGMGDGAWFHSFELSEASYSGRDTIRVSDVSIHLGYMF